MFRVQFTCRPAVYFLLVACCGCGSTVREPPRAEHGPPNEAISRTTQQADPNIDAQAGGDFWKGLDRHEIQLEQTLLLVKGSRGVIACPYLNIETFGRTGEACAIVPAADIDGMLDSRVTAVTPKAKELGIDVGTSGREALDKIR